MTQQVTVWLYLQTTKHQKNEGREKMDKSFNRKKFILSNIY